MNKPKITVLGGINKDLTIRCPALPKPGQTIRGTKLLQSSGGKGANQAVAAARLGGQVVIIGAVGNDSFGKELINSMTIDQIDTSGVKQIEEEPTGTAFILVDESGQNIISFIPGANDLIDKKMIDESEHLINSADVFLVQMECQWNIIQYGIQKASSLGVPVILNPSPAAPLPKDILKLCEIIVPNEIEAEILTGISVTDEKSAKKAANQLRVMGTKAVIITLGDKGAYLVDSSTDGRLIPAPKVESIDAVAAGDVFAGALAVKYGMKESLFSATIFSNSAAALSTTREGAQPSIPLLEEVINFQKKRRISS